MTTRRPSLAASPTSSPSPTPAPCPTFPHCVPLLAQAAAVSPVVDALINVDSLPTSNQWLSQFLFANIRATVSKRCLHALPCDFTQPFHFCAHEFKECSRLEHQQWRFESSRLHVRVKGQDSCLQAVNATLVLSDCGDRPGQKWQLLAVGDDSPTFVIQAVDQEVNGCIGQGPMLVDCALALTFELLFLGPLFRKPRSTEAYECLATLPNSWLMVAGDSNMRGFYLLLKDILFGSCIEQAASQLQFTETNGHWCLELSCLPCTWAWSDQESLGVRPSHPAGVRLSFRFMSGPLDSPKPWYSFNHFRDVLKVGEDQQYTFARPTPRFSRPADYFVQEPDVLLLNSGFWGWPALFNSSEFVDEAAGVENWWTHNANIFLEHLVGGSLFSGRLTWRLFHQVTSPHAGVTSERVKAINDRVRSNFTRSDVDLFDDAVITQLMFDQYQDTIHPGPDIDVFVVQLYLLRLCNSG